MLFALLDAGRDARRAESDGQRSSRVFGVAADALMCCMGGGAMQLQQLLFSLPAGVSPTGPPSLFSGNDHPPPLAVQENITSMTPIWIWLGS